MTSIRPGTPDDAAAYLDLRRKLVPWHLSTAEGVRHHWRSLVEASRGALFAVDDDAGLVGLARCGLNTWTTESGAANVLLVVRPDRRRQGVGSALLAAAEEHLASIGAHRVQSYAHGDPESLDWVRRRGYRTTAEVRYSGAVLADLPPQPEPPAGVTVAAFADLPPEAVYAVDAEATQDEPSAVTLDALGYDDWFRDAWQSPNLRHDLSVAVLVDGEPAACTFVEADPDSGRVSSAATGTRRAYRGRGLAKLAKSVALHRARDAGFTMAYTGNDEVNRPMLAVNEWLGYRAVGAEWECVRTLPAG
ncbi:GNAT family N-acetyltransferase [Polymorphospora sp. NPDC050346]|uniref:GNAT family N-acetyltransferase n=1 Tax=Polymorphospora sp. NPDC050346 TaxID=3155780 RepID=UPI0033CD165A